MNRFAFDRLTVGIERIGIKVKVLTDGPSGTSRLPVE